MILSPCTGQLTGKVNWLLSSWVSHGLPHFWFCTGISVFILLFVILLIKVCHRGFITYRQVETIQLRLTLLQLLQNKKVRCGGTHGGFSLNKDKLCPFWLNLALALGTNMHGAGRAISLSFQLVLSNVSRVG